MFDRCIECERIGQDCVPNLLALPWPDLLAWWKKRQVFLGWSNQVLSDKSTVPLGTINRIKAGEDDCRYSTMRSIIHALMGGYSVEFPCQKKLDQEFAHFETLEKQCAELTSTNECLVSQMKDMEEMRKTDEANLKYALKDLERALADNEGYKAALDNIHTSYKAEIDAVRSEARKKVDYLLDLVAKMRADNDNLWAENNLKSKMLEALFEKLNQGS